MNSFPESNDGGAAAGTFGHRHFRRLALESAGLAERAVARGQIFIRSEATAHGCFRSRDHGWRITPGVLLDTCNRISRRNQVGQSFLRFDVVARRICFVAFDIKTQGCP